MHISYLPLAHILERVICSLMLVVGASIGFYQGNILKMMEDVALIRPTLFITVPRVLNRIYDKVQAGVKEKSSITKCLFNFALGFKKNALREDGNVKNALFDSLVFKKVKNLLGGRVQMILSGGAPIAEEVIQFARICFSCGVYEGYGQTETCGTSIITTRDDWTPGMLSAPFLCCEVKLVDVPEMEYRSTDKPFPRGEICVRGANCFTEYYKDPISTAQVLDKDGWLHTGDIGMFDRKGRTKIIDRKKKSFIFVLSF